MVNWSFCIVWLNSLCHSLTICICYSNMIVTKCSWCNLITLLGQRPKKYRFVSFCRTYWLGCLFFEADSITWRKCWVTTRKMFKVLQRQSQIHVSHVICSFVTYYVALHACHSEKPLAWESVSVYWQIYATIAYDIM